MPTFVGGIGPNGAKLAIVGEAPGESEERHGVPFWPEAPVGSMLTSILSELGVNRNEVYITNVSKYRPPLNDIKRLDEVGTTLDAQVDLLWKELNALNPNCILALGGIALKALTDKNGINKYRGSVLGSNRNNIKVVPAIHPGNIINPRGKDGAGAEWKHILKLDIRRAIDESKSRAFDLPHRNLEIITSAYQLYKSLDQYKKLDKVSIDIETSQCIPYCVGLAFHPYHAIIVPLLPLSGRTSLPTIPIHELADIWIELSRFLSKPNLRYIGQNFKFDHEKLIAPARLIAYERDRLHADTSLMAGVTHAEYPKSLQFLTSIWTKEPYYKDEGKEFDPKKDKIEQKLYYCGKDVTVTYEIYEALDRELSIQGTRDFYYNFVNKLHDFYMEMEAEGVDIDHGLRTQLSQEYEEKYNTLYREFTGFVGSEVNINSPRQISKLLYNDLHLPQRANTQEDTLVALLSNHTKANSKERKVLETLLKLRQLNANSRYLKAEPDYDGKARTSNRIQGAETGRASDSILKPPVRPTTVGYTFKTLPAHGEFAKPLRSIFISSPSDYILAVDLRQAEARIVSFLANDLEALEEFDKIDVYKKTAALCMNLPIEAIDSDKRYVGKKVKLAFGYGIGKGKLMLDINSEAKKAGIDINISEREAGAYLERINKGYPKVRNVFQLEVMTVCIRDKRTLTSPFGRKRTFYGNLKATEVYANIPQSIPPDHIRKAYFRLRELPEWNGAYCRPAMEKHDAINFLIRRGEETKYAEYIKQEFERDINFSNCSLPRGRLKLPCEIKIGVNYGNLTILK